MAPAGGPAPSLADRFRVDCSIAEVIEAAISGEPVAPGSWSG